MGAFSIEVKGSGFAFFKMLLSDSRRTLASLATRQTKEPHICLTLKDGSGFAQCNNQNGIAVLIIDLIVIIWYCLCNLVQ